MPTQKPSPNVRDRKIVGISLNPAMATSFKTEAAERGVSLRKLFEEMWANYEKAHPKAKP